MEKERERVKTGGGVQDRGGVVESKKRTERWRESMFPMRSIELSIILLQAVDGSSPDEEEEEGEGDVEEEVFWRGGGGMRSCFHSAKLCAPQW